MLLALSLQDFVIVEHLNLDFQAGFTVLTGETGAGKSITLDAIALLLGDKADFSQVRNGAKEARLSALFDISEQEILKKQLLEQGFIQEDDDSDELSIRRVIDAKGKSRSFINNQAATLAQLKQIGSYLIDIHGQNAHQSLNQEVAQRQLLDAFAGAQHLAQEVKSAYQTWQNALHLLNEAKNSSENIQIERERLEWQLNEFKQVHPKINEWENLSHSHDSLAHAADLLQAAQFCDEAISGDDGIQDQLYRCQRQLEPLADIEPRFAESLQLLDSIEAELSEIVSSMHDVASDVEINPAELEAQEERMAELMSLARKYRIEPQELLQKQQEIETALAQLEASANIEALQQEAEQQEKIYHTIAQKLSDKRQQAAEKLGNETATQMQYLAMKGAQFKIELLPTSAGSHGLEHIQYTVSANQGSPLRPLNKVASGGELARISLALQVVTSQYTQTPTLIFDEVDTGIGGSTAAIVGKALKTLGLRHQVLAVTHLPQVAACGQTHWQVSKHSDGEQTISKINILDQDGRIEEIARMLGGETLTDTTRQHAAELLNAV